MKSIVPAAKSRIAITWIVVCALMLCWPSALHASTLAESDSPAVEWERNYRNQFKVSHISETERGYNLVGVTNQRAVQFTRLDLSGQIEQTHSFYLTADNGKLVTITGASPTRDGGYILSGTYPDFYYFDFVPYIAKTNADGEVEWSKEFTKDVGYSRLYEVKEDLQGHYIYAIANWADPMPIAAGKLDSQGRTLWERALKKTGPMFPTLSIQHTENGLYTVVASDGNKLDIWNLDDAGNTTWSKGYDELRSAVAIQIQGGGYAIASVDNREVFLTFTDPFGNRQWTQSYGLQLGANSVEQTADGGYLLATGRGVIKTDRNGAIQWSHLKDQNWVIQTVQTRDGGLIYLTENGTMTKLSATQSPGDTITELAFDSDSYSLLEGQTLDTVLTAVYGGERGVLTKLNEVHFTSDDESIVTIDSQGSITGHNKGSTHIRAEIDGVKAEAEVYVFNTYKALHLDSSEYSVTVGEPIDVVVTYLEGANHSNVTRESAFSTGDPSIAIVDAEGNLIGLKRGQTTLTVTYNGLEATVIVDVY